MQKKIKRMNRIHEAVYSTHCATYAALRVHIQSAKVVSFIEYIHRQSFLLGLDPMVEAKATGLNRSLYRSIKVLRSVVFCLQMRVYVVG